MVVAAACVKVESVCLKVHMKTERKGERPVRGSGSLLWEFAGAASRLGVL